MPIKISTHIFNVMDNQGATYNAKAPDFQNTSKRAWSAFVQGTGAVAATFVFECSAVEGLWNETPMATITLSGTNSATDGFTMDAPWPFVRVRLTSISGTNAKAGVREAIVGYDTP